MSVNIDASGNKRRLDRPAEPDENLSESDLESPSKVVQLFLRLLRDVATLRRRWWPRRIDLEDRVVGNLGNAEPIRFPHGLDGRVRWWVVDWLPAVTGNTYILERAEGQGLSDNNTLVLYSSEEGEITLRIEEAG